MNDPKYHSGDLDAITELASAKGYQLVEARLQAELARQKAALESCAPEQCRFHQGQVAGLKVALAIPAILRDEIKAALDRSKE